jgi:LmbE family N-acetylglucosaminyl deacetylase
MSFREDWHKPTFVVDVSDEFEQKIAAIACYESQFAGATRAGEVQPNGESLFDIVRHHAAHYGSYIRTRYAEPYFTSETMRVDDVMLLDVATF